jgi:hypothetical protein
MADLTIRVPGEHVDDVRDSLLHAYAAVAEALHHSALVHVETRAAPEDVLGHRTELLDLDDTLDQLGFEYPPLSEPLEVTGHPEVLGDAITGALTTVVERLDAAVQRYWSGEGERADCERQIAAVRTLLVLLAEIQGD